MQIYKAEKALNSGHVMRMRWGSRQAETCLAGFRSSALPLASQLVLQVSDLGFQQLDHLLVVLLGAAGLPLAHIGLSSLQTALEPDVLLHGHAGLLGKDRGGFRRRAAAASAAHGHGQRHSLLTSSAAPPPESSCCSPCPSASPVAGRRKTHTPVSSADATVAFPKTPFVLLEGNRCLQSQTATGTEAHPKYGNHIQNPSCSRTFPVRWPILQVRIPAAFKPRKSGYFAICWGFFFLFSIH